MLACWEREICPPDVAHEMSETFAFCSGGCECVGHGCYVRRFEDAFERYKKGRLRVEEAGDLLGLSGRHFRRQCGRFASDGLEGLRDKRLERVSSRRALAHTSAGTRCASGQTNVRVSHGGGLQVLFDCVLQGSQVAREHFPGGRFHGSVSANDLLAKRCQFGALIGFAPWAGRDDLLCECLIETIYEQPGSAVRHVHRPSGGTDRAQFTDQLEQPDFPRSKARPLAELQPQRDSCLAVSHEERITSSIGSIREERRPRRAQLRVPHNLARSPAMSALTTAALISAAA